MKARMLRGLLALSIALAVVWTAQPLAAQAASKLPAPSGVKAQSVTVTSIKVSWKAVSGAVRYEVYRATSASGTYTKVKTTTSLSVTNTSLTRGKTYYYKLKAIHKTASLSSARSAAVSCKARLATPVVTAGSASSTSIKVSWQAVSGAAKYEVYRATTSGGTYTLLKTTTARAYTNTGLTRGKTYYYKVKALYKTASGNSARSAAVSAVPKLSAPTGLEVSIVSPTSIALKWNKVSGATGYELYRASSATGTYAKVTTTKNAYYTNTKLAGGRTYYYKVRAVMTPSAANSTLSAAVAGKTAYTRGTTKTLGRGTTAVGKAVTFHYTAPVSGIYYFHAEDRTGDNDVTVQVYDRNGKIYTGYNETNDANATLTAGQTYDVLGMFNMEACTFTMEVGVPHVAWNITGTTAVSDGIGFVGQHNVYYYTAPVTGRYRLDAVDRMNDASVQIDVYNNKNSKMGGHDNGVTMDFTAGQTYRFEVRYLYDTCTSYKLNIGVAHAVRDITGKTTLTDSITFQDQVNRYTYKAAVTGRYRIDVVDRMNNASVNVDVLNSLNHSMSDAYYKNDGLTVDLTAGETYQVLVSYRYEPCTSYRMNIGVPHAVRTLVFGTTLSDSLTYTDQINRYDFTPTTTEHHRILLENVSNSAAVTLEIYDDLNNLVDSSWGGEVEAVLTAGKKYRILVHQGNNDFCTYTLRAIMMS